MEAERLDGFLKPLFSMAYAIPSSEVPAGSTRALENATKQGLIEHVQIQLDRNALQPPNFTDNAMKLTIVGSGDAFGSGGRFNSCYCVHTAKTAFLVDCGASSLLALRRASIATNDISTIFITHLHGDHFGGLPFVLIDALHPSKRTAPLVIAGPPGIEERFVQLAETMFSGAIQASRAFRLKFVEIEPDGRPVEVDGVMASGLTMKHESGAPSLALRLQTEGRTLAFSGDSGWTDTVIEAGRGADLYMLECYQYDMKLAMHMDYETIAENMGRFDARRIVLTHMHDLMLARVADVDLSRFVVAEDGMVIEL
jgi:ribonuclease BN (tRNA processing enzyme)